MSNPLIFVSIPGLRRRDFSTMLETQKRLGAVSISTLEHSFPSVTWPAQAHLLTGKTANEHGVTANGFFWRNTNSVEMWTAKNYVIQRPQIWDLLHIASPTKTSLAWFPMLSKESGADYIAMPAPIHNPDGSEDLWCYTKPTEYYGTLLDQLGHFPLQHFWGPLANIKSSQWIADSAMAAIQKFHPDFSYIYIPHLDYAAQKWGPNSEQAIEAVRELDVLLANFVDGIHQSVSSNAKLVLASEYVIQDVNHVTYPNRILREAGLLTVVTEEGGGELIDFESSRAWALVDHQFSNIYVKNSDAETIEQVVKLFSNQNGIDGIFAGDARNEIGMQHERAGDIILVSTPTVGKRTTIGSTTHKHRASPERSTSIASQDTIRLSCSSTWPHDRFRSMPNLSKVPMAWSQQKQPRNLSWSLPHAKTKCPQPSVTWTFAIGLSMKFQTRHNQSCNDLKQSCND
ncbi:MAG: alkaline phosphatase family protein [Pirellulaceae bacterium]